MKKQKLVFFNSSDFKLDEAKSRDTGLAMVLIFLILALWLKQNVYTGVATAILVVTMIFPAIFKPFSVVWFGLAFLLGGVVSKLVLSLVFLFIVCPVGIVRRLLGIDNLRLNKWKADQSSVFYDRNHMYTSKDIHKPY